MESEKIYDEVLGIIKINSIRSILVLTDSKAIWIPKSLVGNLSELNLDDIELPQLLLIEEWFTQKKGISNGY